MLCRSPFCYEPVIKGESGGQRRYLKIVGERGIQNCFFFSSPSSRPALWPLTLQSEFSFQQRSWMVSIFLYFLYWFWFCRELKHNTQRRCNQIYNPVSLRIQNALWQNVSGNFWSEAQDVFHPQLAAHVVLHRHFLCVIFNTHTHQ